MKRKSPQKPSFLTSPTDVYSLEHDRLDEEARRVCGKSPPKKDAATRQREAKKVWTHPCIRCQFRDPLLFRPLDRQDRRRRVQYD